jgi:nucleotide-binding universal stress UspA family protein
MWTKKKAVLVPFDFSDAAREALTVARSFVDDPSKLQVVYVMPPPTPPAPGLRWGELDVESMRARAFGALNDAVESADIQGCDTRVLVGQPARALVDFARDEGSELVVIPSHGRTGLDRWLMGSVAERVVRLAPCPVLVLRAES